MKLVAYSFTDKGSEVGEQISKNNQYKIVHIKNRDIEGGVKTHLKRAYKKYDGIVFIGATGIAIRLIFPYIKDKYKDLPIIVIDDMGKFSISLLSGHVGGANTIAEKLGSFLGATPVITTASDNRGFESIDNFAKNNNYYIDNKKDLTKIMSMMVNGEKIGLLSKEEGKLDYPKLEIIKDIRTLKDIKALIVIAKEDLDEKSIDIPFISLKTKDINIGVGCKKGIGSDRIIKAIKEELKTLNIDSSRIKSMGTVEVKKDEKGIILSSKHFNCPLKIFSIEEIKKVEDKFKKSDFVKKTIGVYSVSEPSAYLLGGELLVKKAKHDGITISISKE